MTTSSLLDVLAGCPVLPVVTIDRAEQGSALVTALAAGGLRAVEITLRTPAALDAIRLATNEVPDVIVGAGSVTDSGRLHAAVEAGASFAVAPGLDVAVVDAARDLGLTMLPGVATATELMRAAGAGVDVVKVFPAEPIGGRPLLDALAAVWPDVRFVPTGGISPANLRDYLAAPHVLAVGGSWMVPRSAIDDGDWTAITRSAADAVRLAQEAR